MPAFFRSRLLSLVTLAAALIGVLPAVAAERPNVILMMADDLGWSDLSCYGSEHLQTPTLDRMASEGARLTSFYAGCTVCTPSRMALLTGAYPKRLGWPGGVGGYRIPWNHGLATQAVTMAEVFRDAGYATAMCGKWHLGNDPRMLPRGQGFESAFYITASNNQTKKLWRNEELVADPFDNRRLTELFAAEAMQFLRTRDQRPFFLYLPFSAPHFPAEAHPDWDGRSNNAAYGDVVEELDARIGEIMAVLRETQLDRNTIVVFLSDNGPEPGQRKWASAKPFRGLKWSSLEGGNRVPCIARFPGTIPAGQSLDHLTAAIDLLPTLAEACRIPLPVDSVPQRDGVSVWQTWTRPGQPASHPRTELLFWNGWAELEAIRAENWKLYLTEVDGIAGSAAGPVLINLQDDPAEERNVAAEHAERVRTMRTLAEKLAADVAAHSIPLGQP